MKSKKEKEKLYKSWKNKLTKTGDGLGLGIEKWILHYVVILNCLGLYTSQSCMGHTKWGLPFPWVDISPDNDPKYKKFTKYISKIENKARNFAIKKFLKQDKEVREYRDRDKSIKIWNHFYDQKLKELKLKEGAMYDEYQNILNKVLNDVYIKRIDKYTEKYLSKSKTNKFTYIISGFSIMTFRIEPAAKEVKKYYKLANKKDENKKEFLKESRKEFIKFMKVLEDYFWDEF